MGLIFREAFFTEFFGKDATCSKRKFYRKKEFVSGAQNLYYTAAVIR